MQIEFRPARAEDFDYCKRLYFDGMSTIIEELHLDMAAQESGFSHQWSLDQVRIVTCNGSDVGWIQSTARDGEVFVGQLFVDGPFQGQGIGTEVMKRIIAAAERTNQAVSLAVVKTNSAVRLYERLGFYITHQDSRKFYMRRDPHKVDPIPFPRCLI